MAMRHIRLITAGLSICALAASAIAQPLDSLGNLDAGKLLLVADPESSLVEQGSLFKTRLMLVQPVELPDRYSVQMQIDGSALPVNGGVAEYQRTVFLRSGQRTAPYRGIAIIRDYQTGETITLAKEFDYVVGNRAMSVSADKMNVFYAGVNNPVSVAIAGISSKDYRVEAMGAELAPQGFGKYNVFNPTSEQVKIIVSALPGTESHSFRGEFIFRVKAVPDPVVFFGGSKPPPDKMTAAALKLQGGLVLMLPNFDFEARCKAEAYEVVRITRTGNRRSAMNSGARFGEAALALINEAELGDIYLFRGMSCTCSGDAQPRALPNFSIEVE